MFEKTHLFHVLTCPKRDRCTPITISRDIPIPSILQPISKFIGTDRLRNPSSLFVELYELVGHFGDSDKPRGDSTVDKWSAGSPAEGVRMHEIASVDESTLFFEVLGDVAIGFLLMLAMSRSGRVV
jgi:hypothetical protein